MIGNKKAAVIALFFITFPIFMGVFPDMPLVSPMFYGLGFGILAAVVKND